MGIFDAIKKVFDSGGLKVRMKAPKTFKFKDRSIPVAVTITGHKTEPRSVTNMRFTFAAEPKEGTQLSTRDDQDGVTLTVDRTEPVELQPLQEVTVDFVMPLATGGDAGSVGATVGRVMDAMNMFSSNAQWYVLTVEMTVEGAKAKKRVSERIRNNAFSVGLSLNFGN